jgi:hypothetical protein
VTWDHGSAIRSFKVHIGRPDQLGKTAKDGGGFIVHIVDYEGASCQVHTSTWFDLHVSLLPGLCLSATSSPTLRAAEKTRQLYFSSINASVRSGTNARLMLCLLLLVRTRRCTLFIPSGQVEQRTLKVYRKAML